MKKDKRTERLGFRLTKAQAKDLRWAAKHSKVSISDVVATALAFIKVI